jgi:hypothetical protein
MKHTFQMTLLTLLFSFSAMAQTATSLIRPSVKVDCNEDVKICSYVAQNITSRELIAKLNANLFPGSILSPSEGFMTSDGLKKLNFYMFSEELKQKVIAAIPLMDTLEDFDPSDLVLLTTEIYSMTEGGLSNIQASAVAANDPASEIAEWVISSAFGGPTGIALKVGTNLLSTLLASSKIKEESSKVTTISQLIPNFAGISYSNTSKIYISPGTSGAVKEEQAGLTLGGTVSISSRENDLVVVKDYNLTYGVVENVASGERVNILSINNPQLHLVKGTSSILVSSVTLNQAVKTEYSAVSFGKKKEKYLNKLMVVTRAESVSFKDYVSEMKKLRQFELHREFTKEERSQFGYTPVSLTDVLNNIKTMTTYTSSGERIIGFRLDPRDARLDNYKKSIEITVKSGSLLSKGLNQKVILPLETLMLTGLKFDSLSLKELKKPVVEIELTLKGFNTTNVVTKKLFYNPEVNKFIE